MSQKHVFCTLTKDMFVWTYTAGRGWFENQSKVQKTQLADWLNVEWLIQFEPNQTWLAMKQARTNCTRKYQLARGLRSWDTGFQSVLRTS